MRWNGSERSLGYLAFLCTLIAGAAYSDDLESAATRVRPGMTPDEVAAALGAKDQRSRTRFSMFCVNIRNPLDPESRRWRDEQVGKLAAASDARYREYQLFRCVVDVEFDPTDGVKSVVAHRSMSEAWFFTPWPVAAVAAGLAAAELARRRAAGGGSAAVASAAARRPRLPSPSAWRPEAVPAGGPRGRPAR